MDGESCFAGDISRLMKVNRVDGTVTYFSVLEGETHEISEKEYIGGGGE